MTRTFGEVKKFAEREPGLAPRFVHLQTYAFDYNCQITLALKAYRIMNGLKQSVRGKL